MRPAERASMRFSSTVRRANSRRPSGTSASPSAARACALRRADVLALEGDAAGGVAMRAGDGAQQRRLAGAVGADERDRLAGLDGEA